MSDKSFSAAESTQRERLAAYFLAAPPFEEQSPAARADYCRHLCMLGELETAEIHRFLGAHRPLVWGNPVAHLQSLLTAAQQLAARLGYPLMLFPGKETHIRFHTLLHPRVLSLATVNLLTAACLAAPKQTVWVRLQEQNSCLAVTVTAAVPFGDDKLLAIIKDCAALHGGSAAQCDNSLAFSCGRVDTPPDGTHHYQCSTAEEWLRDTLSPVWTGLYAPLFCSSSSASSKISEPMSASYNVSSISTASSELTINASSDEL